MTIGEKILILRKSKNLSQEQLAESLGVSRQAVSKWEAEQSIPDIDKVIAIADFFEVTTDYLLRDIEKIEEEPNLEIDDGPTAILLNSPTDDKNKEKNRTISTLLLAVAVVLYILCPTPLFIMQDSMGLVFLLIIVAVATGLMVFRAFFNAKTVPEEKKTEEKTDPQLKTILSTITTFTLVIYFLASFITGAWHITWIIFLISGAVKNIVSTVFESKEDADK